MSTGFGHDISMPERDPRRDGPFVLRGRWQVVDYLGQGGMGTVYLARDLNLDNRKCVVKKLRDDFFREEDKEKAQQFFLREATVLSKLQHPNIVLVLDSFQEDQDNYLVMEYVEGHNLHDMLKEREEPFSEEQVLTWSRQICDVLHYLHANDPPVIYRDLKPSNIMIDTKDRVKLVDFGIARLYQDDGDNTHVVSQGYSPPEQYWGGADPRSDVYALGATMYFLLTGEEPLALTVCSPRESNEDISEGTDLIVQRATQQDVYLRYQSASDMKEELDYVASEEDVKKPGFRWLELSVGVLVTFLSVGAWFAYSKFVEMRNDNEIQLKTNQQERAILQRRLDEIKKREESLKKANESKFEKMMREQSSHAAPMTSRGGQTQDEFSGMLEEMKSKKGVQPAVNNPNLPFAFGNFTRQRTGNLPRVNRQIPFGGFKYPDNFGQQYGGQQPAGSYEPMMDKDENQITDQEALTPMEEDTQH